MEYAIDVVPNRISSSNCSATALHQVASIVIAMAGLLFGVDGKSGRGQTRTVFNRRVTVMVCLQPNDHSRAARISKVNVVPSD